MQIAVPVKLAMQLLQVWGLFEQGLREVLSLAEAQALVQRVRTEATANWKRLAREAHPDLGGTLERMQSLNAAHDAVKDLAVRVPAVPRIQVHVMWTGGW